MMNFSDTITTGDTKIAGGHDLASHMPVELLALSAPDFGALDLSASLRADGYTSAL